LILCVDSTGFVPDSPGFVPDSETNRFEVLL